MEAAQLLEIINRRHGTAFTLIGRYAMGEQGAYAVADGTGAQFVLKWSPAARQLAGYQAAAVTTALLRGVDYPAPRYILSSAVAHISYALQQALPGAPAAVLTKDLLPPLLELNRLQAGKAAAGPRQWPAPVVNTILVGGDGYCLLETLRRHSPTTQELLNRLQALAAAHADAEYVTNDIVHFDFQPANILVEEGKVSGVVDWEGTCVGDCAFDLATLLFYAYEIADMREQRWRAALERARPGPLSVYLAHLMLRQVDWSIRLHDAATADRYIRRAGDVLRAISRLA